MTQKKKPNASRPKKPVPRPLLPSDPHYVEPGSEPLENDQHEAFCMHYLVDPCYASAARKAGYNCRTADSCSSMGRKLFGIVRIQDRIKYLRKKRAERLEIDADTIIRDLITIARSNILDFVEVRTVKIPIIKKQRPKAKGMKKSQTVYKEEIRLFLKEDIPEDKALAISGLHETKDGIRLTLHPKMPFYDKLGVHLGLWDVRGAKDDEEKLPTTEEVIQEIMRERNDEDSKVS